jgi:hypothetical protein
MNLPLTKAVVGALWILAAIALAAFGDGVPVIRLILLVGVGLVPPLVMLAFWNPPAQTLSESIRDARR